MRNNKLTCVDISYYYIILRHLVAFEFSGFYAEVISADVRVRHIGRHSNDVFIGMEQQMIVGAVRVHNVYVSAPVVSFLAAVFVNVHHSLFFIRDDLAVNYLVFVKQYRSDVFL